MKKVGRTAALVSLVSLVSLVTGLLLAACSVVVDPEGLQQGCAAGTKPCEVAPGELRCVSQADPEYGCARESCVPCSLLHAVEVCGGDGACAVGTCEPEFEDCDRMPKNGCEVDLLSSYGNCGACGASCGEELRNMQHTETSECDRGRCIVGACKDGFGDCDNAASNGCERPLPDVACGRCLGCPGKTECNLETRRCE